MRWEMEEGRNKKFEWGEEDRNKICEGQEGGATNVKGWRNKKNMKRSSVGFFSNVGCTDVGDTYVDVYGILELRIQTLFLTQTATTQTTYTQRRQQKRRLQ